MPTSMTLNDHEWCNGPFCVFSPNSIALLANYVIAEVLVYYSELLVVHTYASSPVELLLLCVCHYVCMLLNETIAKLHNHSHLRFDSLTGPMDGNGRERKREEVRGGKS